MPPECISKFSLCFYPVAFSIGFIVVYTIFFLGAILEEKFEKQNDHFKEFLYSNVLSKVLWYTMVTRRNKFSQKKNIVGSQF